MKSDWLTGKDLIERWSIKDFELLQYAKNGLQPYYKGRAGLQPQLPPGVVKFQIEMKALQAEIEKYEKLFANFSGTSLSKSKTGVALQSNQELKRALGQFIIPTAALIG